MECVAPYSLSNQKQAVYLFKKFKIYRFGPNQSFILIQTIKGKMQQLKVCKLNDDQAQPQRGYNIPMCKSIVFVDLYMFEISMTSLSQLPTSVLFVKKKKKKKKLVYSLIPFSMTAEISNPIN